MGKQAKWYREQAAAINGTMQGIKADHVACFGANSCFYYEQKAKEIFDQFQRWLNSNIFFNYGHTRKKNKKG